MNHYDEIDHAEHAAVDAMIAEEREAEEAVMVCYHCGETVFETEDGLWLHMGVEDFSHLVRPVTPEHPYPFEVIAETEVEG